jgi:hypothetical protein
VCKQSASILTFPLSSPQEFDCDLDNSFGGLLTLSLLMSYIYMELLVKPEILTSYIYGLTFGNAESRPFLFHSQCFDIESMQKVLPCNSCV